MRRWLLPIEGYQYFRISPRANEPKMPILFAPNVINFNPIEFEEIKKQVVP
jgi:hypothetical protein